MRTFDAIVAFNDMKLQWAPLNRITLGHEQFDSNN